MKKLGVGIGVIGLAIAIGLSTSWVVGRFSGGVEAAPIPVTEENVLVGTGRGESEALRLASIKAGFTVKPLGKLPEDGLALRNINIDYGPAGVSNAMTIPLLIYGHDQGTEGDFSLITVTQINLRTDYPANYDPDPTKNTNKRVDLGRTDIEASVSGTDPRRVTYTVWTADRTFDVVVDGKRALTLEELNAMFDGLAK